MLALTDNAASVIRGLADRMELPDGTGLRIAQPDDGTEGLTVAPSETPGFDDQIVEADGARVFVDSAVADMLDDKVLDARVNPEGQVQFQLITAP